MRNDDASLTRGVGRYKELLIDPNASHQVGRNHRIRQAPAGRQQIADAALAKRLGEMGLGEMGDSVRDRSLLQCRDSNNTFTVDFMVTIQCLGILNFVNNIASDLSPAPFLCLHCSPLGLLRPLTRK